MTGPRGNKVTDTDPRESDRTADHGKPRLDVTELVPTVHKLFTAGLAPATQKVYHSGENRYLSFCEAAKLTAFPASEQVLLLFVSHLHQNKLTAGTVKSYLAAVRHAQISRGLGNPQIQGMPQLEYVLKGVKKATPRSLRQRLPITPEILGKIRGVWRQHPEWGDTKMLWAASCLCFFGFLRSGEVVCPIERTYDADSHLAIGDIKTDCHSAPSMLEVTIKASKTEPFRQGCTIYIGATRKAICPVAAMLNYIITRGKKPGPLFITKDGRFLTRDHFIASLRRALLEAGIDASKYAGHSFRIGAATTAARCGIQDSLIKTLGRWESAAYTRYVHTSPELLCRVSGTLMNDGGGGGGGGGLCEVAMRMIF